MKVPYPCVLCKKSICKYGLDFIATGSLQLVFNEVVVNICYECAKSITCEFIQENC
jgi:hypothetical protein